MLIDTTIENDAKWYSISICRSLIILLLRRPLPSSFPSSFLFLLGGYGADAPISFSLLLTHQHHTKTGYGYSIKEVASKSQGNSLLRM